MIVGDPLETIPDVLGIYRVERPGQPVAEIALYLVTVGLDGSRGPVLTGGHVDLEDLFQRRNGKDSVARLLGIFTASGAFDDRSRPLPRLTGQTRTFA